MAKKFILILIVGSIVLAFAYNFLNKNQKISQTSPESLVLLEETDKIDKKEQKNLKIKEITLNVEIADTASTREQGLSGKIALSENEGMLFIFEKEGYYAFWMRDMNFPIDIAWLDKDKKIIHIENNVLPASYPKTFTNPSLALFVLETSAGFFEKSKIKIGDLAEF